MTSPAWESRKLHLIGIGGAGMSGLAVVCRALGSEVTGSDRSESTYVERVRTAGVRVSVGHSDSGTPRARAPSLAS